MMQTTVDFLDALRARLGLTSDYQLHQLLGVSRAHISHYRHGRDVLSDDMAVKVAELLDNQPGIRACFGRCGAHPERQGPDALGKSGKKARRRSSRLRVSAICTLAVR